MKKSKPKGGSYSNINCNHICLKHKYSSRRPGLCPICRQPLECIGKSWRISKNGKFDKVDRRISENCLRIPKSLKEKN